MDFFNDLQQYFATMTQQESLFFWVTALVIFIFAFLLGLLIRGGAVKRYKKQMILADRERSDYETQYIAAQEKKKALEKEVEQLSKEKVAALDEVSRLRQSLEDQPTADADWESREAEYQEEIQLLQLEINQLREQSDSAPGVVVDAPATTDEQLHAYLQATDARLAAVDAKLAEMDQENARLEAEVQELRDTGSAVSDPTVDRPFGTPHVPVVGTPTVETDEDGEPLVIRADGTEPGVRTDKAGSTEIIVDTTPNIHVPVLLPDDGDRDDLQAIKNIGPFLEKKLNEAGVFSYAQIAEWSDEDIVTFTEKIAYLPGRIKTDDWVGQAKRLRGKLPQEKEETTSSPTDLKAVEGVGPKIESVLKSAGIDTLADLATTTPDRLREVLAEAGSRFKSHDPSTWPIQAELANNQQWTELAALQDKLKGGR